MSLIRSALLVKIGSPNLARRPGRTCDRGGQPIKRNPPIEAPDSLVTCVWRRQSLSLLPVENVSWLDPLKAQVFATTRWSVVRACNALSEAQAQEALGELCQAYWLPVYACIRHHGYSGHDAEDLTQEFFMRMLQGRYLVHLDQSKGRFRAYLSVALQNFLHDRWRRWTFRRGRGTMIVSMESEEAERGYAALPVASATPLSLYERQWARTIIEHALKQLRIELAADNKAMLYDHFDAILAAEREKFRHEEAACALNLSPGALDATLHRWRRRFQVLVREEIARTVLSKSEVDDEIRHLRQVLAQAA